LIAASIGPVEYNRREHRQAMGIAFFGFDKQLDAFPYLTLKALMGCLFDLLQYAEVFFVEPVVPIITDVGMHIVPLFF
jgi:hypothetical protein